MDLASSIENLPKIQKPQIAALLKLEIFTVQDLLLYFPYRYLDFSLTKNIKDLKPGENVSIKATVKSIGSRFSFRGRMSLAEAVVSDSTGSIKIVWFNQPYLAKSLKAGDEIFLAGQPQIYNFGLQLTNPIYEKASDFPIHTSRLVPLYHLKQNIYPKTFRNFVAEVLPLAKAVKDILPPNLLESQLLMKIEDAIKTSHFPENHEKLAEAQKRLAFEEIFINQLLAQKHKMELAQKKAYAIKFNQGLIKTFVEGLPFKLTAEQKKSAWEVLQDLEKESPMNRLLEGDVGSGKTLVALIAALQAVSDEYQVALLSPTEILAKQHFETAKKYLSKGKISIGLLTNNYASLNEREEPKAKLQALIKDGMPGLFIGTHALIQKGVKFKKLALVIIDEQHRFGVEQRAALVKTPGKIPHLLSLSATPIPRTLKLAFFGELDISEIKHKPSDRKPILTELVEAGSRPKAYNFIQQQIKEGRQAFVITPLIEESDTLGVKSAKKEFENLKKIFPQFNIGLLHGKLKGKEKEEVMKEFLEQKLQILVATSVVEVGVDVPNASVMVIEGGQRFGLAQLHQFRGRVGRAQHQSFCFIFTDDESEENLKRLRAFCKTQDGFELAELDLKQRGFGELYGQAQSGFDFKYFDPSYIALIPLARKEAQSLLEHDIDLKKYPLLAGRIKDKVIHFE